MRLLITFVAPAVAYWLLVWQIHSEVLALTIAAAIPVTWTAFRLVRRRRVDPLGAWSIATFGVALLLMWLTHGDELVLKLREPVLTGLLGLVLLGSAAVRRPLGAALLRRFTRMTTVDPRFATGMTVAAGATLALHGAVRAVLALTLSTGAYLTVAHAAGLAVLAAGAGTMLWLRGRLR